MYDINGNKDYQLIYPNKNNIIHIMKNSHQGILNKYFMYLTSDINLNRTDIWLVGKIIDIDKGYVGSNFFKFKKIGTNSVCWVGTSKLMSLYIGEHMVGTILYYDTLEEIIEKHFVDMLQ